LNLVFWKILKTSWKRRKAYHLVEWKDEVSANSPESSPMMFNNSGQQKAASIKTEFSCQGNRYNEIHKRSFAATLDTNSLWMCKSSSETYFCDIEKSNIDKFNLSVLMRYVWNCRQISTTFENYMRMSAVMYSYRHCTISVVLPPDSFCTVVA
jgi:hypothetical protein